MEPTRRHILAATAGGSIVSALTGCGPGPERPPAAAPFGVDVHCHVFNARDVPIRQFVSLVYLEHSPKPLQWLLAFICHIMDFDAPDTTQELAELRGGVGAIGRDHGARRALALARAVQQMLAGSTKFDPPGVAASSFNPSNRSWMLQQLSPELQSRIGPAAVGTTGAVDLQGAAQHLLAGGLRTDIDFAANYIKARWELTDDLAALSPGQEAAVRLYTPALLDIDAWFGATDRSAIGPQIAVMELISARKGRRAAVHAFVPFDPWRAIGDPTALETVKDAIRNRGCLGIKLYPPMGFKPENNDAATFPPTVRPAYPDAARRVDAQLALLFAFCLAEDVPILAHCSDSQAVSEASRQCANPIHWQAFLDRDAAHAMLRLNLGHFGGPWTANGWTETVVAMLGSGKYPNLYSDLSDADFVLPNPDPAERATMDRMTALLDRGKPGTAGARSRLMYGTDWSLLARNPGFEGYYDAMQGRFSAAMRFTDAERAGYLGRNALDFLGLRRGADGTLPASRRRLEAWRDARGLDRQFFRDIDAA